MLEKVQFNKQNFFCLISTCSHSLKRRHCTKSHNVRKMHCGMKKKGNGWLVLDQWIMVCQAILYTISCRWLIKFKLINWSISLNQQILLGFLHLNPLPCLPLPLPLPLLLFLLCRGSWPDGELYLDGEDGRLLHCLVALAVVHVHTSHQPLQLKGHVLHWKWNYNGCIKWNAGREKAWEIKRLILHRYKTSTNYMYM